MGSLISSYNTIPNADRSSAYSGYGTVQIETDAHIATPPALARLRTDKAGDTLYSKPHYIDSTPALLENDRYDPFHAAHNND